MIVRLTHIDGHEMAFEAVAFNNSPDAPIRVSFVSPTGKDINWDAADMEVIEEMTIHYDSGVLLTRIKGMNRSHISGRSTGGMS